MDKWWFHQKKSGLSFNIGVMADFNFNDSSLTHHLVNSIADLGGYNELCLTRCSQCRTGAPSLCTLGTFYITTDVISSSPFQYMSHLLRVAGWWFQPLWKMMEFVSWDDDIPIYEMEVIKFHGSKPPTRNRCFEGGRTRSNWSFPSSHGGPPVIIQLSWMTMMTMRPWEYWTNHTDDWGSKPWLQTPPKRDLVLGYVGYKML